MRQRSGRSQFEASPGKIVLQTLSRKYPTQNRAGGVVQVLEHLHSKLEDLSSKEKKPNKQGSDKLSAFISFLVPKGRNLKRETRTGGMTQVAEHLPSKLKFKPK
jgi:hypothetical protein